MKDIQQYMQKLDTKDVVDGLLNGRFPLKNQSAKPGEPDYYFYDFDTDQRSSRPFRNPWSKDDTQATKADLSSSDLGWNNQLSPSWSSSADGVQYAQNTQTTNKDVKYNNNLGSLSSAQESAHNSNAIGYDKAGGHSYGKFQIATNVGTMGEAIKYWNNKPQYKQFADNLNAIGGVEAAKIKDPKFVSTWKEISKDPLFEQAQYDFIYDTHYVPVVNKISDIKGLNLSQRNPVVRKAIFSMAVQHGGAANFIKEALENDDLGKHPKNDISNMDDETLLRRLYNARAKYVKHNTPKMTEKIKEREINIRYPNELNDALNELKQSK